MDNKNALRQQARAAREAWEERYLQSADSAIARRILEMEIWRAADTVFTYVSIGREVDTRTLIEAALAQDVYKRQECLFWKISFVKFGKGRLRAWLKCRTPPRWSNCA